MLLQKESYDGRARWVLPPWQFVLCPYRMPLPLVLSSSYDTRSDDRQQRYKTSLKNSVFHVVLSHKSSNYWWEGILTIANEEHKRECVFLLFSVALRAVHQSFIR